MALREPEKMVIDDFDHQVHNLLESNKDKSGCPQMSDYGITKEDFENYIFDKQAILDFRGTQKTKFVRCGIFIVLPVIILSAFPEQSLPFGKMTFFAGICLGLLIALFVESLMIMIIKVRVNKNADPNIDKFIRDLEHFDRFNKRNKPGE